VEKAGDYQLTVRQEMTAEMAPKLGVKMSLLVRRNVRSPNWFIVIPGFPMALVGWFFISAKDMPRKARKRRKSSKGRKNNKKIETPT